MLWIIRVSAVVIGAMLLVVGRQLRQDAAAGEMPAYAGPLGLVLTIGAYVLIIVVLFILKRTKIPRGSQHQISKAAGDE